MVAVIVIGVVVVGMVAMVMVSMGVSGILGGLIDGSARSAWAERAAFLAGMIALPALLQMAGPLRVDTHITSKDSSCDGQNR